MEKYEQDKEILMKYIRSLHSHMCSAILLSKQVNIDEACAHDCNCYLKVHSPPSSPKGKGAKAKGKKVNSTSTKKKSACHFDQCGKVGCVESSFWKLHPKNNPNKQGKMGKKNSRPSMNEDNVITKRVNRFMAIPRRILSFLALQESWYDCQRNIIQH